MKTEKYILITFKETADALYMERVCREDGMEGRIIPLPKSIDAGCGLSWHPETETAANGRNIWRKGR